MTRTRDIIRCGAIRWFEYHCWESMESADAELWLHSHQVVKVLKLNDPDSLVKGTNKIQRAVIGHPATYKVRFRDGKVFDACEDELMVSKSGFSRPHPPGYKGIPHGP